jgi:hypothetical protein
MAAGVLVAEVLMSAIAGVRRMVVTPDPSIARRCDDLLRSQVIGRIQFYELFALGYGCMVEGYVVVGLAHSMDRRLFVISLMAMLCSVLLLLVAAVVSDYRGRLGGRVTGWWNRPMPG